MSIRINGLYKNCKSRCNNKEALLLLLACHVAVPDKMQKLTSFSPLSLLRRKRSGERSQHLLVIQVVRAATNGGSNAASRFRSWPKQNSLALSWLHCLSAQTLVDCDAVFFWIRDKFVHTSSPPDEQESTHEEPFQSPHETGGIVEN